MGNKNLWVAVYTRKREYTYRNNEDWQYATTYEYQPDTDYPGGAIERYTDGEEARGNEVAVLTFKAGAGLKLKGLPLAPVPGYVFVATGPYHTLVPSTIESEVLKDELGCPVCEEYFNPEQGGTIATLGEHQGWLICERCESSDRSEGTPVYHVTGGSVDDFVIGSYAVHGEYDESQAGPVYEYAKSIHRVATDAWRGYYTGHAPEGWINVLDDTFSNDGVIMGDHTDAFRQVWNKAKRAGDFPEDLEMLVCFPLTSNVCTCGIEVYLRDDPEVLAAYQLWVGWDIESDQAIEEMIAAR